MPPIFRYDSEDKNNRVYADVEQLFKSQVKDCSLETGCD